MDQYTVEEYNENDENDKNDKNKEKNMVRLNQREVNEDEFKRILEKSNKFPPGSITIDYKTPGQKIYMFKNKVVFTEYINNRNIPKDIDD